MAHYNTNIKKLLDNLQEPTKIPVMTILGTYCPVTKGHLGCLVEGRKMLMGQLSGCPAEKVKAPRPTNLPIYKLALGFIGCNDDHSTKSKMCKKGCPEAFIEKVVRLKLIDFAAEDEQLAWLQASRDYHAALKELQQDYPMHTFIRYSLNGADDVLKYKKWRHASGRHLSLCAGRPSEAGKQNGTEDLINAMTILDDKGPGSDWYNFGYFTILPELKDISSSKVRTCLQASPQDIATLQSLLHPTVLRWSTLMGPFAPPNPPADLTPFPNSGGPLSHDMTGSCCMIRRQCEPYETLLREFPSDDLIMIDKEENGMSPAKRMRGNRASVADGELVHLLEIDPTKRFGLVFADSGAGWIRLKYVFATKCHTIAFVNRQAVGKRTLLRVNPREGMVKDCHGKPMNMGNGEKVMILHPMTTPDGSPCWDFVMVFVPSKQTSGWLNTEHLRFSK